MTATTMGSWGTVTAGSSDDKKAYTKYKAENKFRIVGDILPAYKYWLSTQRVNDEGKTVKITAPFDCLSFDATPGVEKFTNGAPDPIKELGLQNTDWQGNLEFDKKGNPVPLKPQRMYLFPIINRENGEYEYATLKGDTLIGIQELMQNTAGADDKKRKRWANPDYVINSPMDIDIVLRKSGAGLKTKYTVDVQATLEYLLDDEEFEAMVARFKEDEAILKDKKPIAEVFPRPTYAEQKEAVDKFFNPESDDEESGETGTTNQNAAEAMDELDD